MDPRRPVLVTGATGYVGSRLIPLLLESGCRVRAVARSEEKLRSRPWASHPGVEIAAADILNVPALRKAVQGCSAAYYLVHSMNPQQRDFAETDRVAAQNMVNAADEGGLDRIIYLSGLGEEQSAGLSKHLKSRTEVARILQSGKVPVTVFRAAMIIGSGSASFEILRYLVDRLPLMVTPRWVNTPSQPIAIRNVLYYLCKCLEFPVTAAQTYDIGGEEVLTYQRLMEIYAEEAGLARRWVIPVPVLTPRLSSYWIHLVTPVPASIARPLAEGLRNPVVCHDQRIREIMPQKLLTCREAVRLALEKQLSGNIESHWTDAGTIPPVEWSNPSDPAWAGGTVFEDKRVAAVSEKKEKVWQVITSIGGKNGWYYADWLWQVRGFLDRMIGGVGLRRGRRDPVELLAGDALDFWRVARVKPMDTLTLVAEMKLPGKAVLEFTIREIKDNQIEISQAARFLPRGLSGILYWYFVSPFHSLVFQGLLKNLVQKIQKNSP